MSPRAEATVPVAIINDTRVDGHHGCTRVMATLEHLLARIGCRVVARAAAHADWRNNPEFLRGLSQARLVVVNGEGTIHHDRAEGARLLDAGAHARALGIPAVLLNCSWQANSAALSAKLRDFALVAAREPRSVAEIRKTGTSCRVVPDLSLYHPYQMQASRSGIGVSDSVTQSIALQLESLRLRVNGLVVPIQFSRPGIAGALRFFRGFPGKRELANPPLAARLFALRLRQFHAQVATDRELLDRIGALNLLVSGRFHAITFALLTRTPFITAETNSHKIVSLVEEIGLSRWRLETTLEPAAVKERADAGWESDELSLVESYLDDARHKIDGLFAEIRGLL